MRTLTAIVAVAVMGACQSPAPGDGIPEASGCQDVDQAGVVAALTRNPTVLRDLGRGDLSDSESTVYDIGDTDTARIVVTLSWGGPTGGGLLLADCGGQLLDSRRLGYVREAQVLRGGARTEELLVRYIAGTGTGWSLEETALIGFDDDSVAVLWKGTTHERSLQSVDVGAYEIDGSVELLGSDALLHSTDRVTLRFDQGDWQPVEGTEEETSIRYVRSSSSGVFEVESVR